ncbi:ATP-independent periplasmic protein-refolding chaperone Spy [Sodalis endosymbiont of Spalangia cameroni]|uniref:ATP-independent periplasmic protein-refolding chaperone Spy n=1 Tax=Sodalis praecaptivus TaxID=1239307 RepID=UPI0031F7A77C
MRKLTAFALATSLMLGTVQLASAADTAAAPAAPESAKMHHHPKHGPMMEQMFKDLNLTTAQREQMRDIARDSMKNMKKPSADEHKQLHDVIAADNFDSSKAQALVTSMSQAQNERMLARLEMQNKMYNVLTPAQKQEFNNKFEARQAKMAEHGNN